MTESKSLAQESSLPRWAPLAVLCLVFLLHTVLALLYLHLDRWPLGEAAANHFVASVHYLRTHWDPFDMMCPYPPLLVASAIPFYYLFGVHPDVACLANLPFFALYLWAMYALGSTMGGRRTGVIAAVVASFFPGMFGLLRSFLPALAAAALVAWHVREMLRWKQGAERSAALAAGASLGLACLAQPNAPLLVLVLDLWLLFGQSGIARDSARARKGVPVALAAVALVAGPWVLVQLGRTVVTWNSLVRPFLSRLRASDWFSAESLFAPVRSLWEAELGAPALGVAIFCLLWLAARGDSRWKLPAIWIGGACLLVLALPRKTDWDLLPAISSLALAISLALDLPKRTAARSGALAAVLLVLVLDFLRLTTREPTEEQTAHAGSSGSFPGLRTGCYPRGDTSWKGREMVDHLVEHYVAQAAQQPHLRPPGKALRIMMASILTSPMGAELLCASAATGIRLAFVAPWDTPEVFDERGFFVPDRLRLLFRSAEYAMEIHKKKEWFPPATLPSHIIPVLQDVWWEVRKEFEEAAFFELPLGYRSVLLRRRKEAIPK